MSAAWVTKEELDENGQRRRGQADEGLKGVKAADRFVVEWIDPNRKRCREKIKGTGKDAKQVADERCKQLNSQLTLGSYKAKADTTWADVKERYVRDILPTKRSDKTRISYRATLAKFEQLVRPKLVASITTAVIDRFISERLKETVCRGKKKETTDGDDDTGEPACEVRTVSHATVNTDLRNLKAFFKKALKWKAIAEMPDIQMLEETETEKPVYTQVEFEAMYNACDVPTLPNDIGTCPIRLWWRTLLVMFWETGMRRGELLSLEWREIDMDRRCVTVDPVKTKSKRLKQFSFDENGEKHLTLLREHRSCEYVFPWPHEVSRLNDTLGQIQEKAKLEKGRRNWKFHAFRRTVGEMTAENHGLTAAQYKLGHSNAAITAKHYARAAMRKLGAKSSMPRLNLQCGPLD